MQEMDAGKQSSPPHANLWVIMQSSLFREPEWEEVFRDAQLNTK